MVPHGVFAVSAIYGAAAAEATNAAGGGTWGQLAAGSITAIIVALIGVWATWRRRKNWPSDEDVNAITIARTAEVNVAQLKIRVDDLDRRTGDIEDHVRPWPKERR